MFVHFIILTLILILVRTLELSPANSSVLKREKRTSISQDYVFSLPDITVEYFSSNDKSKKKLKAFKTRSNNEIINGNQTERYGQLEWVSMGVPILICEKGENLFNWYGDEDSFYVEIGLLNFEEKTRLKERISKKYGINVSEEQIVNLPLSEFKCLLRLRCNMTENSRKRVKIYGIVKDFNINPARVYFEITEDLEKYLYCIKKNLFHKEIVIKNDYIIECDASQKSLSGPKGFISISASHLNKLDLEKKIFGDAESKYVTRYQLDSLSSFIFSELKVFEEYEINQDELRTDFINAILKQTSLVAFEFVPFNEALNLLSTYSFEGDLKPDIITSELSNALEFHESIIR